MRDSRPVSSTRAETDHHQGISTGPCYRNLYGKVDRRETNAYIDGTASPASRRYSPTAVARERGGVTHWLLVDDLNVLPLTAELFLQALRPVVREYYDIEASGASLDEVDIDDGGAADDA